MESKEEKLERLLLEYISNAIGSRPIRLFLKMEEEELLIELANFQREWDLIECDEEGDNNQQLVEIDKLLNHTINILLNWKQYKH